MTSTTIIFFAFLFFFCGCASSQHIQQPLKDVKELSADKYKGRKAGTPGNQKAAEYIIGRFEQIGLIPYNNSFKNAFTFEARDRGTVNGNNLIGYIPGKRPDIIVISAHYDHVGVVDGEIYNGADDNATGVGGLLALAQYFCENKPQNTLIFAALDAEEDGLRGAKAFVANPAVSLDSIKLNINLDMIGRSVKNELYVAGTYHYPQLKKYLLTSNNKIKLLAGHDDPQLERKDDWTNQSDQGAFHAVKIPFLYFGVEDHEDYHRPTDDYKRIDARFYTDAINAILEVVKNIDRDITIQKIFRDKLIMEK